VDAEVTCLELQLHRGQRVLEQRSGEPRCRGWRAFDRSDQESTPPHPIGSIDPGNLRAGLSAELNAEQSAAECLKVAVPGAEGRVVHLKVGASPATENGEGLAEHMPFRLLGRLVRTGDEQAREVIDLATPKEQVQ
jgi:hypothetical protein